MNPAMERSRNGWLIFLTLALAAVLSILPLPAWFDFIRPEWMALVVIYWAVALPHRMGMFAAWLVGLCMDLLQGSLLGVNALTLALLVYLAYNLYQRLRMFTMLQQCGTVLILVGIHQIVLYLVLTIHNQNAAAVNLFMISALTSALIWPLVFVILRFLRRSFDVT